MPLRKILLKVIALTCFALFIIGFIVYQNTPVAGNKALARNILNDTTGKVKTDTLDTIRFMMSSSKSMILTKEKPLVIPHSLLRKMDTARHIRMDTPMQVKKDTAKISLLPKQ